MCDCENFKGPKGDRGDRGDIGLVGLPGPDGKDGLPGPPGINGLNGYDGIVGYQGPMGPVGPAGENVSNQTPGPKGPTGDKGPVGDPGVLINRPLNGVMSYVFPLEQVLAPAQSQTSRFNIQNNTTTPLPYHEDIEVLNSGINTNGIFNVLDDGYYYVTVNLVIKSETEDSNINFRVAIGKNDVNVDDDPSYYINSSIQEYNHIDTNVSTDRYKYASIFKLTKDNKMYVSVEVLGPQTIKFSSVVSDFSAILIYKIV